MIGKAGGEVATCLYTRDSNGRSDDAETEGRRLRMNDLMALFADYREKTGQSYGDIAGRTNLSRATIYNLATKQSKNFPRPETLRQVAQALNLPERTVRDAAMASVGIKTSAPMPADPLRAELQLLAEELPVEHLDSLVMLFRSLIASQEKQTRN